MSEILTEIKTPAEFDAALENFLRLLNEANVIHHAKSYPGSTVKPNVFKVCTRGQGRKQVRIISVRESQENSGSAYCFVEYGTGKIMKPGGWKAPEPKRFERGNIFRANPLEGCGPYGVEYRVGGGNFKFRE